MRRILALLAVTVLAASGCHPAPKAVDSSAVQVDPAHTGVARQALPATPKVLWSLQFGRFDYSATPLILRDLVVVPINETYDVDGRTQRRVQIVAHRQRTGAEVWRVMLPAHRGLRITAANGRIFASTEDEDFADDTPGSLFAFDQRDGHLLWRAQGRFSLTNGPTAAGDDLYTFGGDHAGPLTAWNAATGTVRWTHDVGKMSGNSSPAVDGNAVYVSSVCGETAALRRSDGAQIWYHLGPCYGGGASNPVVANGKVYVTKTFCCDDLSYILDLRDGTQRGTFTSSTTPNVDSNHFLHVENEVVVDRNPQTNALRWQTPLPPYERGNGRMAEPLVIGDVAYVVVDDGAAPYQELCVPRNGSLERFRLSDGRRLTPVPLGGTCGISYRTLDSIAAANGIAAIPIGDRLVVVG